MWLSDIRFEDLVRLGSHLENNSSNNAQWEGKGNQTNELLGVILMTAPWVPSFHSDSVRELLEPIIPMGLQGITGFAAICSIQDDNDISLLLGDDSSSLPTNHDSPLFPLPPASLPAIALVHYCRDSSKPSNHCIPTLVYANSISSATIIAALAISVKQDTNDSVTRRRTTLMRSIQTLVHDYESEYHLAVEPEACSTALRLFIAGDRSSVGKSSVCLGIIGTLLRDNHFASHELAYIKPATQSESTQLIQVFCEQHDIACVPIGPLVYYRGFTRAFLADETPTSDELLERCARAVDRICRNKKVVLVDGVGFPAVGSICGTDNASVLKACSYPIGRTVDGRNDLLSSASTSVNAIVLPTQRQSMGVVLVGGSGVGAAVDAYNLNATYFASQQVPVLGAIFNKLALSGFYSLENCKEQITRYFERQASNNNNNMSDTHGFLPTPQAFGFVPLVSEMTQERMDDFIDLFSRQVDVPALLTAASQVKERGVALPALLTMKRLSRSINKNDLMTRSATVNEKAGNQWVRSRQEIEQEAIRSGAKKSA